MRRVLLAAALGVIALAGAELAARLDDWIRLRVPLDWTPNEDHDLKFRDRFGVRGRPHGRYRKWKLNNFGFRGPDIERTARPGCQRIMVVGASETFGLYESDNREYPAQLQDSLAQHGCFEVVNAAIVGAGLQSIVRLWENYLAQFEPTAVAVYPSPAFYLGDKEPEWTPVPSRAAPDQALAPRPRLIEQFKNAWSTPAFMQRRRLERWMAADTTGKPASWFFQSPPEKRLDAFMRDLDSLVKSVRANGAEPVLMTHAMRFTIPPDPNDELILLGWRHYTPRATTEALLGFEVAAAQRIRAYARRENLRLVDLQRTVSGRRECFGDAVHFTDKGAAVVAGLIAHELLSGSTGSGTRPSAGH